MSGKVVSVDDLDAVGELAERIVAGSTDIDPTVTAAATRALVRHLRRRFPAVGHHDLTEAVQESVARLTATARAGGVRESALGGRPGGYLTRIAERLLIDQLRSARWAREEPVAPDVLRELALTDDEVVRTLDRRATSETVRQVLRRAQARGDATIFRVATHMLDVAQLTGRLPSNRETARACGLSHTGVADALRKLRRYFPE